MKALDFFSGLFTGADTKASVAKCMLWPLFTVILIQSFLPRGISESLVLTFQSVLIYALGGKYSPNIKPGAEK